MLPNPMLTFVVPVRHPDNTPSWERLQRRLRDTLRSISQQTSPDWRCVVVANVGADLGLLPEKIDVVRVNFPPNGNYDLSKGEREIALEAFRLDKGRRVLQGMLHQPSMYYMIVDDDDFVSRQLTQFVASNPTCPGWYIDKGFAWQEGSKVAYGLNNFHDECGTCHIIRRDLYDFSAMADNSALLGDTLGSHKRNLRLFRRNGYTINALPFAGAVYRYGHRDAHSGTKTILGELVFNRANLRNPHRILAALTRIRLVQGRVRSEFALPKDM